VGVGWWVTAPQPPNPNPQSPIPNPQKKIRLLINIYITFINKIFINNLKNINKNKALKNNVRFKKQKLL